MKKISLKQLLRLAMLTGIVLTAISSQDCAANSIMFQPGPGQNNGSDEGGANGGKDSYTTRHSPGANHGAEVLTYADPRSTCNDSDSISFIQFDVSSLPANVDKVYLGVTHVPHTSYCYSNCSADFYFYPVSSQWNEMTISNSNMPAIDTAHPAFGPVHITFPNDLGVQEYDITDIYRAWKSGTVTNNGLAIYSPTVGCNNASVFFAFKSSDESNASQRPYLRIESAAATTVPLLSNTGRIVLMLMMAFGVGLLLRKRNARLHL